MATAPVGAAQADGWTAATLHASPPFFPVSAGTSLNPKGLLSTTAAWKRAQQQGVEDARRALQPDTRTPFASFEDAAQRLLPYHVFATEEGDEQDTDELGACSRGLRVTRVFVTDSTRGVHPHSDAAGERRAGEPRRAVAGHVCAQGAGLQSRGRKVRRRGWCFCLPCCLRRRLTPLFRAATVPVHACRQGALIDEYEAGRVNQGALRPEEHFTVRRFRLCFLLLGSLHASVELTCGACHNRWKQVARMIYEETRSRQGPGKPQ